MADKTIGELVRATQITATDLFVLEQNATAKCLTGQILINWLTSYADGHGGIQTITKTSTSGLVDTYTITLADTTTTSFTVTNGAKGDTGAASYVHIRYAANQPTRDADMGTTPDKWIGIYSGTSSTAPTHYTSYAWYQYKGETGATGTPASISTTSITYQAGTSATTAPTGTWTTTIPTVTPGNYLWTKTVITFNTGSPVTYYSVARQGIDGTGAVSTVNGKSPTSGNVQLDGADINVNDSASPTQTVKAAIESAQNSINEINTSVLNLQTADTQTRSMISDAWSSSSTPYAVGSYAIYNNKLWKCLTANSVAPSEGANWTEVSVGDELKATGAWEELESVTISQGTFQRWYNARTKMVFWSWRGTSTPITESVRLTTDTLHAPITLTYGVLRFTDILMEFATNGTIRISYSSPDKAYTFGSGVFVTNN